MILERTEELVELSDIRKGDFFLDGKNGKRIEGAIGIDRGYIVLDSDGIVRLYKLDLVTDEHRSITLTKQEARAIGFLTVIDAIDL